MDAEPTGKTVIGEDVEITGTIKSAGDVQLAGVLNGDLSCGGRAVVSKTARIQGNITAEATAIEGQINGNITVKDRIELKASARVHGDIRAKRLTVEDGVTLVGKAEVTPSGTSSSAEPAPASPDENAEPESEGKGIFGRK